MTQKNVDKECFSHAIKMLEDVKDISNEEKRKEKAKKIENTINKSLGVLQENGVFAFYVYLKSENEDTIGKETISLLDEIIDKKIEYELESIKSLADDITTLLFAKALIEKTLIYARYHAKALSD